MSKRHNFKQNSKKQANKRLFSKRVLSRKSEREEDDDDDEGLELKKYEIKQEKQVIDLQDEDQEEHVVRKGQTFDQFKIEQRQQQKQCWICQSTNFQQGKYILGCNHSLCNQCFRYWSTVSNKCPVCLKKSKSVHCILNGASRTVTIQTDQHIPECVICHRNSNFNMLYFCDECNRNCVHTYCETSLNEEVGREEWVCEQCICKGYNKNHFAEESPSEYSADLRDFIANDRQEEFDSNSFIDDEGPSKKYRKDKKNADKKADRKSKSKSKQVKRINKK